MTQYAANDEEKTAELVRQLDSDTTWLRHRGRAAELDYLLLRGATSSELAEVRLSWKGHITHLRKVHRLTVVELAPGYWRIVGSEVASTSIPSTPVGEDDALENDSDYEDGGETAEDEETLSPAENYLRLEATARALSALAKEGLLGDPLIKASVGMLIRQATESHHWHNCAHYRSNKAAEVIRQATKPIRTASEYQAFCRRNLRHEHVVPNSVVYEMLCAQKLTDVAEIAALLRKFCIRATIARDEDAELTRRGLSSKMPPSFRSGPDGDPLARYVAAGLAQELQPRPNGKLWYEVQ